MLEAKHEGMQGMGGPVMGGQLMGRTNNVEGHSTFHTPEGVANGSVWLTKVVQMSRFARLFATSNGCKSIDNA